MAEVYFQNDTPDKGSRIPPLEAGTYAARCFAIVDVGHTMNETYKKLISYVYFGFEIPSEQVLIGGDTSPRTIWTRYTLPGTNEKANLRKMLEQWRGKAFTNDEIIAGFPLSKILGSPCMLTLTADPTPAGIVYNHIAAVSKLMKGVKIDVAITPQVIFSVQNPEEDLTAKNLEHLPQFLQDRVKESTEYIEWSEKESKKDGGVFTAIDADDEDLPF